MWGNILSHIGVHHTESYLFIHSPLQINIARSLEILLDLVRNMARITPVRVRVGAKIPTP
jgi:hypothetical protein